MRNVAINAYEQLYRNGMAAPENQVVVVMGDSGAGKTENVKIMTKYLAAQSAKAGAGGGAGGAGGRKAKISIESILVESSVVLEAFGNAATVRNNNSSRFGKFTRLVYDGRKVKGARADHFFLEKSRVTRQDPGENNYHIFSMLLSFAYCYSAFEKMGLRGNPNNALHTTTADLAEQVKPAQLTPQLVCDCLVHCDRDVGALGHDYFRLRQKEQYRYMNPTIQGAVGGEIPAGKKVQVPEMSDLVKCAQFIDLRRVLDKMGCDHQEQLKIFITVSAIMCIGNIEVGEKADQNGDLFAYCPPNNNAALDDTCFLLGGDVNTALLQKCFCQKLFVMKDNSFHKNLTKKDALLARDGMARLMFCSLFDYLVGKINDVQ